MTKYNTRIFSFVLKRVLIYYLHFYFHEKYLRGEYGWNCWRVIEGAFPILNNLFVEMRLDI